MREKGIKTHTLRFVSLSLSFSIAFRMLASKESCAGAGRLPLLSVLFAPAAPSSALSSMLSAPFILSTNIFSQAAWRPSTRFFSSSVCGLCGPAFAFALEASKPPGLRSTPPTISRISDSMPCVSSRMKSSSIPSDSSELACVFVADEDAVRFGVAPDEDDAAAVAGCF